MKRYTKPIICVYEVAVGGVICTSPDPANPTGYYYDSHYGETGNGWWKGNETPAAEYRNSLWQ